MLGAVCSIGSIWWSIRTTPEISPSGQEIAEIKKKNENMPPLALQFFLSILTTAVAYSALVLLLIPSLFSKGLIRRILAKTEENKITHALFAQNIEIIDAIAKMPKLMWQLALIYLFQWYALFCYWQNSSKSIALSVWKTTPSGNEELYEKAVSWTGLVNGWYNIVTFLSAFVLVWFARRYSPKLVHFGCLTLAGIGFLLFPFIENKYLLFPAITGFGIGWASMMGIPYLMVVSQIPKERYGVYMGIINMMIVIPMFIQTTTFGFVMKNFLGNHAGNAIAFAGIFLLIAATLTLFVKSGRPSGQVLMPAGGGH
jgi:maltose/moltooligosaccharide transporter